LPVRTGIWTLVLRAASHGELGDQDQARLALDRAKAINPGFLRDPQAAMSIHHFPQDVIDHLIEGLIKAGWAAPPPPADLATQQRAPG
jgi:hypothetical protein